MFKINNILSRKTKYYLIYIYKTIYNFIHGIKLNQNKINIYIMSLKIFNNLIFLKYNSISFLNNLVDIVVVDYIYLKNRFEINYIF
jgi:hypothetical protein